MSNKTDDTGNSGHRDMYSCTIVSSSYLDARVNSIFLKISRENNSSERYFDEDIQTHTRLQEGRRACSFD